jgi:beta-lactamase regulating signal transducer with metallopeptidase domain
MTTLLQIALVNAVTVVPLALLAGIVGRFARRPALSHIMWVLVLLKFITPPLFNTPVTVEVPVVTQDRIDRTKASPDSNIHVAASEVPVTVTVDSTSDLSVSSLERPITDIPAAPVVRQVPAHVLAAVFQASSNYWTQHSDLLLGCWLIGVFFWTTLQVVRAMRFQRRIMRDAIASPELQQQTQRLAKRLGLRTAPQVLIVNAKVSPMLWGCGSRAKLLFPSELADRLNDSARATLLTHELAHYGRGDHWVRLLELVVLGLFWWHPVAWWATRQIEESEEECCDAWVIGEFPREPIR